MKCGNFCIKIYSGFTRVRIVVKDKCNNVVCEKSNDYLGNYFNLPIDTIYKVYIYAGSSLLGYSVIYAKFNELYCICLNQSKHLITLFLEDKFYPNLEIEMGEIELWQNM